MYTSQAPRYARSYYSSPNQSQSYSPTKFGGYGSTSSSAQGYDDQQQQHQQSMRHQNQYYSHSPPLKAQNYHRGAFSSSAYGDYYNSSQHYPSDGTTYYHSGSSTASSSQDGYYGDDLDDFDEMRNALGLRHDADPEMTTVPTVPTPIGLSLYEHGKTPSGRVLVTSSNQTIEFFSCVVNAPIVSRAVFAAE